MAAIQGDITSVTSDEISGWAWDSGSAIPLRWK